VTKKQQTFYGIIGLILGIFGGTIGTSFSMGAEKQKINDSIIAANLRITAIQERQVAYEKDMETEMDRYAEIISTHITQLQENITKLNTTVGDLRTDVHVLKALMERMETDLKDRRASN